MGHEAARPKKTEKRMNLDLHPEAKRNYDEKAEKLLTTLAPDPYANQPRPQGSFEPGIYIEELPKGAITSVEIGDSYVDGFGKEVAKYFKEGSKNIGLFEDNYKNLIRLAEDIQNNKTLRDVVSKELLKNLIFNWISGRYKNTSSLTMTEYVLTECEKHIKEFEIWIPISMLLIFRSQITVGRVTFKTVTEEMLDAYLVDTSEMSAEARVGSKRIRKELQGYAAASSKVLAEPQRAYEIAYDEAEQALALLRFYSPVNFDPNRVSYITLLGEQHIKSTHRLIVQNGKIVGYTRGLVDRSSPYWRLDQGYIADLRKLGLDVLSDLLSRRDRTDFQDKLLASLFQYSKNCLAGDPADKLVNILVALESAILKDDNEPLGKNIGERMAALIGSTADERKEILSNVAKTYSFRSSFIHHGKRISLDEFETLKKFMMNAWRCLGSLIDVHYKNPKMTRSEFFAWVEERRLSY